MDLAHGDASDEHQKIDVILRNNSRLEKQNSSSSSSSSDASSEGDFFQLDAFDLDNRVLANREAVRLASESSAQNGRAGNLIDADNTFSFSPGIFVTRPAWDNFGASGAMQSPPAQTMGRFDVPDPNRIPSSIFARTTTAPMEWSVASNESLFSIHMGRSGELINYPGSPFETIYNNPPVSPANSNPVSMGVAHVLAQPSAAEAANAEAMEVVMRAAAEEHANKKQQPLEGSPNSNSISRNSDGSVTSFRSFAFPILEGDKNGSVKIHRDHHQLPTLEQSQQPAAPVETPKAPPAAAVAEAAKNRWFPCFSCSICCCYC